MVIRLSDARRGTGEYDSLDDRMLVLDFQAGNPEAFVEIHKRYRGLARHVCRRVLANQHDAEEAFQETMIRVFQGLHRFNGRYKLQPWISRIATNVSLDMIRARARRPLNDDSPVDEHDHVDLADRPEEAFERLVQRDLVLSVLTDLPDTHRHALILRELEGRSHREIGNAMGMSSSQAKALIHRAKGSFRRRWMEKVADRGGLAGVAFLPLIWLVKVADTVRRVAERAGHAVQAAQVTVPEVVTSAATQSVAATTNSGFGERVIAAGMTLLVAGGVTVGATTMAEDREGDRHQSVRATASPAVVQPAPKPIEVIEPKPKRTIDRSAQKEAKGPPEVVEESEEVESSTTVEPTVASESPLPEPTESPSLEPTEEPSPDPVPTVPEAPLWGFDLSSSVGIGARTFQRTSSSVTGKAGQHVSFRETAASPRLDRTGKEVGKVRLEYWGDMHESSGMAGLWLFVDTPNGTYKFEGRGILLSMAGAKGEGVTYVFSGSYSLVEQPVLPPETDPDVALHDGTFELELKFWLDGKSLYSAALNLVEA